MATDQKLTDENLLGQNEKFSLSIKTKSVEQTLLPLVQQVSASYVLLINSAYTLIFQKFLIKFIQVDKNQQYCELALLEVIKLFN